MSHPICEEHLPSCLMTFYSGKLSFPPAVRVQNGKMILFLITLLIELADFLKESDFITSFCGLLILFLITTFNRTAGFQQESADSVL